ncbi:MAG: FKBP-type peptidyl-prolyl cis-trans isomerase [Bacteroidales bacterium]|nr:FKBP-type peptidyl-prolyl cis-trans isomerase [Bacteroidales bacterium]
MKHKFSFLIITLLLASCAGKDKAPQLLDRTDTLSWAMGENIGMSLKELNGIVQLDNALVQQAIRHTLDGKEQPLGNVELREALSYLIYLQQTETMRKDNENEASVNKQQEAYFAQLVNERPNVKRHETGFYYEQVKAGKGRNARYGDRIKFDYRSYVMFTGEPYDQTYGKRDPIVHVVGKPMFQGLIDGMQLMQAGSIYRFYFPYQLAFGPQGSGEIPGFTPFIYEVEMHEIY